MAYGLWAYGPMGLWPMAYGLWPRLDQHGPPPLDRTSQSPYRKTHERHALTQAAIQEPIRVPKTEPGSPRGVFTVPGCFLGVRVFPTYQFVARTLMAARAHRFLVSGSVFITHKV